MKRFQTLDFAIVFTTTFNTCYRADEKRTPRALSMRFAGSLKENEGKHVV
jgi:hypothetical protein